MYDTAQIFILGLLVGFTGALAPGPTLVATINASLKGNWTTGLWISLGHMLAESVLFLMIVLGFTAIALPYTSAIAGIGGIALIVFGVMTVSGSRGATMAPAEEELAGSPFMAGIMTSVSNPYFWIWWLTIGSVMVMEGLRGGILLAGAFMIGHWSADTGWFTLVSFGFSRGKKFLSDSLYQRAIAICGIFLIVFGIYYLSTVVIHT